MLKKLPVALALAAAIGAGTLVYAASTGPADAQAAMSAGSVPCTSAGMQAAVTNFKSRLNNVSMTGDPDKDYMHLEMIISNANERVPRVRREVRQGSESQGYGERARRRDEEGTTGPAERH